MHDTTLQHAYVHACMHSCMHACTHNYTHIYIYIYICVCVIHADVCIGVYVVRVCGVCVCVCLCMCVSVCVCGRGRVLCIAPFWICFAHVPRLSWTHVNITLMVWIRWLCWTSSTRRVSYHWTCNMRISKQADDCWQWESEKRVYSSEAKE